MVYLNFFCLIFSHHVMVLSKSRWPYQNSQWGSADGGVDWSRWELQGRTRCYQRVLLGIVVVSRVCEDFLLKKETWSHSRCCLVCKWLKFFCRILNVTGSSNRTGSILSILSGKWMCKWVAKLWGERKWRAPTFFPCTLLLCLLLHATRLWLLSISHK